LKEVFKKYYMVVIRKMEQVLICLKKNRGVNIDVLDSRRRELVALGNALLARNTNSMALHIEKALDAGATRRDILQVVAFVVGDARFLSSIIEILKALRYEENKRAEHISVVDDVRE